MCFSPQRRAFFRYLNFKKWSGISTFWKFLLANARFVTVAYIFPTSEITKVVQIRHVLYIFISECTFHQRGRYFFFNIRISKSAPTPSVFLAFSFQNVFFCHSGVQFLISPLSSSVRTRLFNRQSISNEINICLFGKTEFVCTSNFCLISKSFTRVSGLCCLLAKWYVFLVSCLFWLWGLCYNT